jgi:hypothetical protein
LLVLVGSKPGFHIRTFHKIPCYDFKVLASPKKSRRDMDATGTPIVLDNISDPEAGLALLAKAHRPDDPERERSLLFWTAQFRQWRQWLDGDTLAIARALHICTMLALPPPRWLYDASMKLCEQRMSPRERQDQERMGLHMMRYEALVQAKVGRTWAEAEAVAVEMLAVGDAEISTSTVRESYSIIKAAGGRDATLQSYRREVRRRGLGKRRSRK